MSRRASAVASLLLVAGMLVIPALSGDTREPDAGDPDPISVRKIPTYALGAAIATPVSQSVSTWLEGPRVQQRTYPRISALAALVPPVATILALETLRSSRGWHAQFLARGRAVSSRAPPASAYA
jgi:hypothetical protein